MTADVAEKLDAGIASGTEPVEPPGHMTSCGHDGRTPLVTAGVSYGSEHHRIVGDEHAQCGHKQVYLREVLEIGAGRRETRRLTSPLIR